MSAVDGCERTIRREILLGELRPGERLPAERALAERLGVNRATLRAALARLASARLVTVRQGSGYVVQDYRKVAGLELLPELAALAVERGDGLGPIVADLLEVRRRMARMALEHLAARAEEDALSIEEIEEAVDRFAELAADGAGPDELADADLEVTAAILAATGSPVLGLILNPVSLVVRELEPLRRAIYRTPLANVAGYRFVLGWLGSADRSLIEAVMDELRRRDAETVATLGGE